MFGYTPQPIAEVDFKSRIAGVGGAIAHLFPWKIFLVHWKLFGRLNP